MIIFIIFLCPHTSNLDSDPQYSILLSLIEMRKLRKNRTKITFNCLEIIIMLEIYFYDRKYVQRKRKLCNPYVVKKPRLDITENWCLLKAPPRKQGNSGWQTTQMNRDEILKPTDGRAKCPLWTIIQVLYIL